MGMHRYEEGESAKNIIRYVNETSFNPKSCDGGSLE